MTAPVTMALGRYPWTEALIDGTVALDHAARLEFVHGGQPIVAAFRPMVRDQAFDIAELAWCTYLMARERGIPLLALPVFPFRRLPHRSITVNARAGIRSPLDLQGRRVGMRGYTVTPGVLARALLAHDLGVDIGTLTYVCAAEEHVPDFAAPPNVDYQLGADIPALLTAGELDAAIVVAPPDGRLIRPLIEDSAAGEADWLRRGLHPTNHVIVMRGETVMAHPDLPQSLYAALAASAEVFFDRVARDGKSAADQRWMRDCAVTDRASLAPGLDANRRSLEASIQFSLEQGLISAAPIMESLFHPVTSVTPGPGPARG